MCISDWSSDLCSSDLKDPRLHGEAIAIGMICEAWLSHQKTGLEESALIDIRDFLLAYYPSYVIPEEAFPELTAFMQKDKKNEAGKINFTLLESIGAFVINPTCTEEELRKALAFYTEHIK